jgi:hypothetical protein
LAFTHRIHPVIGSLLIMPGPAVNEYRLQCVTRYSMPDKPRACVRLLSEASPTGERSAHVPSSAPGPGADGHGEYP